MGLYSSFNYFNGLQGIHVKFGLFRCYAGIPFSVKPVKPYLRFPYGPHEYVGRVEKCKTPQGIAFQGANHFTVLFDYFPFPLTALFNRYFVFALFLSRNMPDSEH